MIPDETDEDTRDLPKWAAVPNTGQPEETARVGDPVIESELPEAVTLWRRLVAEFVGTAMLVTIIVGSGIAAQQMSPGDSGLQLLENTTATAFGLGALILMFGPVSGAHFNPVVSAADWYLTRGRATGLTGRDVGAYMIIQVLGAISGAQLANVMFDVPVFATATTERSSVGNFVGEIVATAGLVALICMLAQTGRSAMSAAAVPAYIGSACWFTSSIAFANPAATIGRASTDTFTGIAPESVPLFVIAQLIGGMIGVCLATGLWPDSTRYSSRGRRRVRRPRTG
ncbi:MIP/aquaporin family protein [Rhodococcus sp. NPDC127530]|uniref:MIP/aquaporin family protein n=1 Tax=unclassified Rhodococcus (in: high G+C Gram-positive bacteria) TaxID=192944 RepID=UPI00363F4E58